MRPVEKPGGPDAAEARVNAGWPSFPTTNSLPPFRDAQQLTQVPDTANGDYGPRSRAQQSAAKTGQFEPPTAGLLPGDYLAAWAMHEGKMGVRFDGTDFHGLNVAYIGYIRKQCISWFTDHIILRKGVLV